jgi:hypothetical protein
MRTLLAPYNVIIGAPVPKRFSALGLRESFNVSAITSYCHCKDDARSRAPLAEELSPES